MFCPKCGKESADNAQFCTGCGNSLRASSAPDREYRPETPSREAANGEFAPPPPPAYTGPAGLIRAKLLSPLFIVAMISFSVYVAFTLIGAAATPIIPMQTLHQLIYQYDLPIELLEIVASVNSGSLAGTLIGSIPQILVVIGGWMLYASACSKRSDRLNPTGMSAIRASTIINFIMICVLGGIILIALLVFGAVLSGAASMILSDYGYGYGYYEISTAVTAVVVIMFVIVAAVLAFLIVYGAKVMSTAKTLTVAVKENVVRGKISSLVIGICYVVGVLNAIGALASIFDFISFIAAAGAAVSTFCFGMLLSDYQKSVYR